MERSVLKPDYMTLLINDDYCYASLLFQIILSAKDNSFSIFT